MQTPNTDGSFFDQENLKHLFLSSQGRINRQRFWQGYLPLLVLSMVGSTIVNQINQGLGLIINLAFLYPFLMVHIKRAHDRNRSGHFVWLFLFHSLTSGRSLKLDS